MGRKHTTKAAAFTAALTYLLSMAGGASVFAADEALTVTDAITLTKYLLAQTSLTQEQVQSYDLHADGTLDVYDLGIMKRKLLEPAEPTVPENVITVDTIDEIFEAMRGAQPGDIIEIAPGTYDYTVYQGAQKIDTSAAGTETQPITVRAQDPENPPVLTGTSPENGYVMHIKGDYWVIENLHFTNSQKGLVLDNSSYSIIRGCEVSNTGSEAIALRDGSSYCLVQECYVHDTGLITPGYGEGVYIGSAMSTTGFDYQCDYNVVDGCTFRNVAAEHVDVKEYTTGTEIMNCTFYGDGMTGENFAGSFVDIAGNEVNVHDNIGYRNQNPKIVAAFELHEQVSGWGYDCRFTNNTLYMDREYGEVDTSRRMYVVDGWYTSYVVSGNLVDYGNGLVETIEDYYNSSGVIFE